MDAGSGRSEYGDEDGTSRFSHVITMGVGHFVNEVMSPQQSQLAADGCRAAATLGGRGGLGVVQQGFEIPVAKTIDEKVAMIDGGQQGLVLGPGQQTAHPELVPAGGFLECLR